MIELESRGLFKLFDGIAEILSQELIKQMQAELRQKDAIATGYLYRSFTYYKHRPGEWLIVNEAPYSLALEKGVAPHRPPYDAILNWVRVKKKETDEEAEKAAWRVLKKIEREGYEPRYYARDVLRRLHRRTVTVVLHE